MIRIMVHKMMDLGRNYIEAYGLSTDVKPVSGIATGSFFLEVDTGAAFLFDEDNEIWYRQGGVSAAAGGAESGEGV